MTFIEPHLITHCCLNCGRHFALHQVRQVHPAEHTSEGEAEVLVCPICGCYDPVPLSNEQIFPSLHAIASAEQSALAFAHQSGINAVWLDAVAQVISRLTQYGQTVAPSELKEPLQELAQLGYLEFELSKSGTLTVSLLGQPTLLANYFWSVWVPHHLLSNSLKVAVVPRLSSAQEDAHHCTVVFRIPGAREAAREFLTDLATQYPGCTPEIVAIQAGDALRREGSQ